MTLFIKYIAILLRKSPEFILMYFVAMHYKKHSGLFSKRQGKERGGWGGRRGPNNQSTETHHLKILKNLTMQKYCKAFCWSNRQQNRLCKVYNVCIYEVIKQQNRRCKVYNIRNTDMVVLLTICVFTATNLKIATVHDTELLS